MAPLDGAFALAEREDIPVRVAEHLDLDMAGRRDDLLQVERRVAERRIRLGARGAVRVLQPVRLVDPPHPLAATARRRLEEDGEAELRRRSLYLTEGRRAFRPRHERDAGRPHLGLGGHLVPQSLHDLRGGPDEHEVVLRARTGERGFSARNP